MKLNKNWLYHMVNIQNLLKLTKKTFAAKIYTSQNIYTL